MALKFAFAVNSKGVFKKKHFGDSKQFLIYEQEGDKLVHTKTLENEFRRLDEKIEHGSKRKAQSIINFLKENQVNVLVSMQFGKNIKVVNEHFIPVIIYSENVDEVLDTLNNHLHWIAEEWEKQAQNYKLFVIKHGIMKTEIEK